MSGFKLGKLRLASAAPAPAAPAPTERNTNVEPESTTEAASQPVAQPATTAGTDATPAATAAPTRIRLGGLRLGGGQLAASASPAVVADSPSEPDPVVVHEPGTPEGFQARLDKLDALVTENDGLSPLVLDTARHYVKDIFIELGAFPEFDSIFKDRDMHNMMVFMQSTTIQAKATITKSQERSATRAAKKVNTDFGDFGSFGDSKALLPGPVTKAVQLANQFGSGLEAIANLNVDDVESKDRRDRK